MVALALLLALGGCAPSPPPDLVLVTIDTLRADAVGAYGRSPSPTPVLDGLAAQGWLGAEVMTTAPLTLPAHASLLTGTWPTTHGIRANGAEALPGQLPTVAERLRDRGWSTGAFVSAVVLDQTFGLDRGFQIYQDGPFPSDPGRIPERDGRDTVSEATSWILEAASRAEPFFVWVHLYDPHMPYTSRPSSSHQDAYLAEVEWADAQVGDLVAMVRALDRPHGTVFAVVADHGEGRGDHGESAHGWFVYRSTMAVPWIMAGQGVPHRVEERVLSAVDLAPTLLGLAGVEEDLPGVDVLGREWPQERVVYGETWTPTTSLGFSPLFVVQDPAHRYIQAPRPELYAWTKDPTETRDLSGVPATEELSRRLADFGPGAARAPEVDVDRAMAEQLLALGYASPMGPVVDLDGPLPDPKDDPKALARIAAVVHQARSVPPEQGVPLLRAALERHPSSPILRNTLARGLAHTGELSQAVTLLEGPQGAQTRVAVAEIVRQQGQPVTALELLEEARGSGIHAVRGAALVDMGRYLEAIPSLRAALEEDPTQAEVRHLLGTALASTGSVREGYDLLHEERDRFGASPVLDIRLAKLALALEQPQEARDLLADLPAEQLDTDWEAWAAWAEAARLIGSPQEEIEAAVAGAGRAGAPEGAKEVLRTPLEGQ